MPDLLDPTLEPCRLSTLSMPNPMEAFDPLALSRDLREDTDLLDLVGLDGTGVLSSAAAYVVADLSIRGTAADCRGDIATESLALDGSAALLRCQKSAGESGLLLRGTGASSRVRDVVRLSLEET